MDSNQQPKKEKNWIPAICIYFIFSGILCAILLFTIPKEVKGDLVLNVMLIISVAMNFICAGGLYLKKSWGRILTMIFCVFIIANFIYSLAIASYANAYNNAQTRPVGGISFIVSISIIKYLINQKKMFS